MHRSLTKCHWRQCHLYSIHKMKVQVITWFYKQLWWHSCTVYVMLNGLTIFAAIMHRVQSVPWTADKVVGSAAAWEILLIISGNSNFQTQKNGIEGTVKNWIRYGIVCDYISADMATIQYSKWTCKQLQPSNGENGVFVHL